MIKIYSDKTERFCYLNTFNTMKKLMIISSLVIGLTVTANFNAAAQKKGLSKQGKGAIIGGAGGAVAGGLIGHN